MVRSTVLKMEGLHTRQYLASGAVVASSNGSAVFAGFYINQPGELTGLGLLTAGSDEKVYLRSARKEVTISNGTNCTLVFRTYKVRARKNCTQDITTLLGDQAPAYLTPYIDPTTSTAFRRYFKIMKRKIRYVRAGECFRMVIKRFYRSGKVLSGDVEGNAAYTYTPITSAMLIWADTMPLEDTASGLAVSTAIAKFNTIQTAKYTYYLPEDNDPDSTLQGGLSAVVGNYNLFTDVVQTTEDTDT